MIMYMAGAIYLLKVALGCTVAGLTVTVLSDKDIHKLINKVGKIRMLHVKHKPAFEVGNEHATVIGLTQHGKTYATIKTLEKMNEPILFFNTQESEVGKGWTNASEANTEGQIMKILEQGRRINFIPSTDLEVMSKELKFLTDMFYKKGRMNVRFVIDEVHLFKACKSKDGHNSLIRLATTGLGRGFKCIFLSQRPAMVDNTLYTQSTKHIIFALGLNDYRYLESLGFPGEVIKEKTNNEKYIFCEFDQKNVTGAFKIK